MLYAITKLIFKCIFTPSRKGQIGELQVERQLQALCRTGFQGKILKNVYVPKASGGSTEIDVLFLTKKGIFVLESKNYSGKIYGKESEKDWKVTYKGSRRENLYNPIWQNRSHIKWLKEYLGVDVPFFSVVVFSNSSVIKCRFEGLKDAAVINVKHLNNTITKICQSKADVMTEQQMDECQKRLHLLENADDAEKRAHIKEVSGYKRQTWLNAVV